MGTANILVGACILLLDLLLRETFGIGMVLNILLVSVFTDLFLALNTRLTLLPRVGQIPQQILFCLLALGGEVGLGTFIFVLCGGPILQGVFRLLHFDVKAVKNESVLDTWRILTHRQAG